MKTGRFVVVLAVLSGCVGTPEDAWVGVYDVTSVDRSQLCDGTEPIEVTDTIVMRIERDGAGAFIAGDCRFPLRVSSDTYATLAHVTCHGSTSSGTPLTITITGGSLHLDGDHIWGDQSYRADLDGTCIDARLELDGWRR